MLKPRGDKDHRTWSNFPSVLFCFRDTFTRKDINNFFLARMRVELVNITWKIFSYIYLKSL